MYALSADITGPTFGEVWARNLTAGNAAEHRARALRQRSDRRFMRGDHTAG
jgi:hypothetical protein